MKTLENALNILGTFENENFVPVKNYPLYWVSDHGRVISWKGDKPMFLSPCEDRQGYHHIKVYNRGEGRNGRLYKVHRLVGLHFLGDPDINDVINHLDGNKLNNHVSNLEWTTTSGNMQHANVNGLIIRSAVKVRVYYHDGSYEWFKSMYQAARHLNMTPRDIKVASDKMIKPLADRVKSITLYYS